MAARKNKTDPSVAIEAVKPVEITAYKGFNLDMTCRDYQYEIGKTYHHEGAVKHCNSGFHACENPLNVFDYYAPGSSKFFTVKMSGEISREPNGDTKIASAVITIEAELTIPAIVSKAIEWITALCTTANAEHATGDRSASSATGDRSASSATGYQSASSATGDKSASSATGYQSASSATGDKSASSATGDRSASSATGDQSASSATGDRSASSATGYQSASSATGYQSASSATGYQSASSATGKNAVAMNIGLFGKAKASKDGAIVVCAHDDDGNLIHIRASKVGDNGIKPDVFYVLNKDGEFVEATE